jgi:hypothetical protein
MAVCGTAEYLSFGPMAQCVMLALKGLVCRASPSRARRGHKNIIYSSIGPNLRYPAVAHKVGGNMACTLDMLDVGIRMRVSAWDNLFRQFQFL